MKHYLYSKILSLFNHSFVQNQKETFYLCQVEVAGSTLSGDTKTEAADALRLGVGLAVVIWRLTYALWT